MKKFTLTALLLAAMPMAVMSQDCPATPAPYFLNFETATVPSLPACTTPGIGIGPQWTTVNNPGHGFTDNALQRGPSVEQADSWFFTQAITLTPGSYRLSYRYGNDSAATTEKLRSVFVTDPAAPVVNYIGVHDAVTGGVPVEYAFENPLTISETATYYIGFNAYSDPNQGTVYVDNIALTELVCSPPQAISVTNIGTTTATISWLPQPGAITIGYFYGVSTTNTPPTDFDMTPNLTRNIVDLQPNTTYYAFASTLCGSETSEWISMQFTTACATATVPYAVDFEGGITLPGVPDCTTVSSGNAGTNWQTVANPGHGFNNNTLQYTGNSETAADAWFITQGIYLEGGARYRLSYRYGNDSTTTTEGLRVAQLTSPDASNVTDYFITHNEITGGTAVNYSHNGSITVNESGIYYFGFNAFSASAQGNLYLDDIEVNPWVCDLPQTVNVNAITTTNATISWQPQSEPTTMGYFYGFSTTDVPPTNFTMTPGLTANLENLTPGTTYYAYVRTFCGATFSDWVSVPFTTQATNGLSENAFTAFSAYPNPVNNILTLDNAVTIEKIQVYNVTGQLILEQNIKSNKADINLEKFTAGAYFLSVYSGDSRRNVKFIKQ